MSSKETYSGPRRCDRREFVGIGVRTAAVLTALPAASLVFAGCGNGEERREPAAPTPAQPGGAPSPPRAEAPPPAPKPPAAPAQGGEDQLVTEVPAVASIVTALQYTNQSPKPDQNCANCQLYTAGSGGRGKCQLFAQGLVKEAGWCVSWVAKVS